MALSPQRSRRLKGKFLEHFATYGNVTQAARHVGIDRTTVYWWQEHDDAFATAFRQADIQATEVLEQEARRRAVEGVTTETPIYAHGLLINKTIETKYSDTLLIFLLKARAPEKYRERHDITTGGQPISTAHEDLDAAIERRLAEMAARGEGPDALAVTGQIEAAHA